MNSDKLSQALKEERDRHNDLRAKLLLARGEVEKAKQTQARISHTALTAKDAKAMKQLESAEQILANSTVRLESIEAAIAQSESLQAQLKRDYDQTANEERFQSDVVQPFAQEIENAAKIESHFLSSVVQGEGLRALLRSHLNRLNGITRQLVSFHITAPVSPAGIFHDWLTVQLHGLPGFNADRYTRERYAGSYAALLQREFDRIMAQREKSRPQIAVNE